jgi:hypothetical protein
MKTIASKNTRNNTKFNTHKHKPENKDNMDSREGEEQIWKGTSMTHNHRAKQSARKTVGKDSRREKG